MKRDHRPHSGYNEGFAALAALETTLLLLSFLCQQTSDDRAEHKRAMPASANLGG